MTVTISEIAKRAGVSRSTVSRALKDHPRIGEATKRKIRRIADELGYVPNHIAQSLSVRRTQTFGMVISSVSNPFTWKVIEGVDMSAHTHGYSVLFSTSRNEQERELEVIDSFRRRRVDGIIIISSHMGSLYSHHLSGINIPVVLINNQESGENLRSVTIDDYLGARQAVKHLLQIGHRRIVYLGPLDRLKSNEKRYAAYQDMIREAGLQPLSPLRTEAPLPNDLETGHYLAPKVIESGATAAFCYNDSIALGLMAGLRERQIRVPQDISVIGFDDIDEARHATPRLTTIRQPQFQLGQQAVEMLLQLLHAEDTDIQDLVLPCELIRRDSTCARL